MVDKKQRLRAAIDAYGTQRKVALALDVTPQSVGKWLRTGSIEVENLHALSKLTGYSFEWLAVGEGEERAASKSRLDVTSPLSERTQPIIETLLRLDATGQLSPGLSSHLTGLLREFDHASSVRTLLAKPSNTDSSDILPPVPRDSAESTLETAHQADFLARKLPTGGRSN